MPAITASAIKNFIFCFVIIFIFLFSSNMSSNKAKGEQYTITNNISDVDIASPIRDAGASKVYKYIGVWYDSFSTDPS